MTEMRLRALVSGTVQGVFFRVSSRDKAVGLGLRGWVRNLPGGEVECVAEGERQVLEDFLGWLRHGPGGASVENVDFTWGEASGEFSGFSII